MVYPVVVILCLLWGGWRGWRRGFVYQLASVLAVAFGIVAARLLGPGATEWLEGYFPHSDSPIAAYTYTVLGAGVAFVVVYALISLLAIILRGIMKVIHLGALNSIAGAALGIAKWVVLLSVILNVILALKPSSKLADYCDDDDGNIVELVMDAAPALMGIDGPDELEHQRRMEEAMQYN